MLCHNRLPLWHAAMTTQEREPLASVRLTHWETFSHNLQNLLSGNLASILMVSSTIPRKGRVVDGPSTFQGQVGHLNLDDCVQVVLAS